MLISSEKLPPKKNPILVLNCGCGVLCSSGSDLNSITPSDTQALTYEYTLASASYFYLAQLTLRKTNISKPA